MMTKFELDDKKGRELFKDFCSTQSWCKFNKEAKNPSSPWDVSYYSGGTKMIGEIKIRDYNFNSFDTWIMEKKKFDSLKPFETEDTRITYINIFKDNKLAIWDLSNTNPIEKKEGHQSNNYTQDMVEKTVFYLNTTGATIYNYGN